MSLRERLRIWWRGYSDADVASLRQKLHGHMHKLDEIIWLTPGEDKALRSGAHL